MAADNTDEAQWIERFVAKGGTEAQAREIFARTVRQPRPARAALGHREASRTGAQQQQQQDMLESDQLFGDLAPTPTPANACLPAAHSETPKRRRGRPRITQPITQKDLDLFELSLEIDQSNARESQNLGFMATAMIYAALPHSEVFGPMFKRKSDFLSLTILNDPDIGLPYGKTPRLITAFLCTEAKRQEHSDNPETIYLGTSQSEFARKLGLGAGGGPRGGITQLKEQAKRLFTSRISLTGAPGQQFHWRNINISDSGYLLWDPQNLEEKQPWNSKLKLSSEFFEECISHSVPLDMRVLHQLRSPLAIDIYIWLTYRYNAIKRPTPISWLQLKFQFGAGYADDAQGLANFMSSFKTHLRSVTSIYPAAKLKLDKDKLTLFPSPPHILPALKSVD